MVQERRIEASGPEITRLCVEADFLPDSFNTSVVRELWSCFETNYGGYHEWYTAEKFTSTLRGNELIVAAGYHSQFHYDHIWKILKERYASIDSYLDVEKPAFLYPGKLQKHRDLPTIHVYDRGQRLKMNGPWEI